MELTRMDLCRPEQAMGPDESEATDLRQQGDIVACGAYLFHGHLGYLVV
jgi:hypothetical protein